MPEISILTPAFDARDHIGHAARSLLAQEIEDFEWVIASDDGQDYLSILNAQGISDPRIRQVFTGGKATGVASARNCALDAAQGRVALSMDADDRLRSDALKIMAPLVLKHGAAYSDVVYSDLDTGEMLQDFNRSMPEGLQKIEETLTSNIHTYAWIAFDRQRLPDLRWPQWAIRWEDVLFFADCFDALDKIYFTPEKLYFYHRRAGSICNRKETGEEFHLWAKQLLAMLRDEKFIYRNASIADVMKRYLERRIEIERRYIKYTDAGKYTNFLEFMRDNSGLFYSL